VAVDEAERGYGGIPARSHANRRVMSGRLDAAFASLGALAVLASVAMLYSTGGGAQIQELDDGSFPAHVEGPDYDQELESVAAQSPSAPVYDQFLARHDPLAGFNAMTANQPIEPATAEEPRQKALTGDAEAPIVAEDERRVARELRAAEPRATQALTSLHQLRARLHKQAPYKSSLGSLSHSEHSGEPKSSQGKSELPAVAVAYDPQRTGGHVQVIGESMPTPQQVVLPTPHGQVTVHTHTREVHTKDAWGADAMGEWDAELVAMQHAAEALKQLYPEQYPKLSQQVQKIADLYPVLRTAYSNHDELGVERHTSEVSLQFESLQAKVMELERKAAEHKAEVQYYEEQDIPQTSQEWKDLYAQLEEEVHFVSQYFPAYAAEVQEHVNNVKQIQDLLQGSTKLKNSQEEGVYRHELSDSIEALYEYVDRLADGSAVPPHEAGLNDDLAEIMP